jgi:hypothetical protein
VTQALSPRPFKSIFWHLSKPFPGSYPFMISSELGRSSRAGQNRKPPRQNQPFLSHFGKRCRRCRGFGHDHNQKSRSNESPMQAANLTQSPPDAVACHCRAQPPRSYQAKPRSATGRIAQHAQTQQATLRGASFRSHQGEFPTEPDARTTGESKPLRPRCAGGIESRHPWAASACDRAAGDG